MTNAATVHQTYDAAGPEAYAFVDLLDRIGAALGRRRVRKVHAPLTPIKLLTAALDWLPFYPLTADQLTMLEEENVADPTRFYAELGTRPEPLETGLRRMLAAA